HLELVRTEDRLQGHKYVKEDIATWHWLPWSSRAGLHRAIKLWLNPPALGSVLSPETKVIVNGVGDFKRVYTLRGPCLHCPARFGDSSSSESIRKIRQVIVDFPCPMGGRLNIRP